MLMQQLVSRALPNVLGLYVHDYGYELYPESAISQSLDGTVMVAVIIDKFGNVINTSTHSSPHKSLNTAALAAAKLLKKFEPHLEKGQVVPAKFILPVRFILPL